ncbi:hypothetical protein AHAS_Ahas02G0113500 [Arachis hypogaea]
MEFPPMLDEEMWPSYEGQQVRPNPHLRHTMERSPVSTRIWNEMDEVEPGLGKRCGLCKQPGIRGDSVHIFLPLSIPTFHVFLLSLIPIWLTLCRIM